MKKSALTFILICAVLACVVWVARDRASVEIPEEWSVVHDVPSSMQFYYPDTFGTTYLTAFDWPPQLQVLNGPLTCVEAGSVIERAGKTEKRTIGGREFCVTEMQEGAAGSVYTQYAYATAVDTARTAIFTFSTRMPQCANYDMPERSACEAERGFDLDGLVAHIAQTLTADVQ